MTFNFLSMVLRTLVNRQSRYIFEKLPFVEITISIPDKNLQ